MKHGVSRRPEDWIDTKLEQPAEENAENVVVNDVWENDDRVQTNVNLIVNEAVLVINVVANEAVPRQVWLIKYKNRFSSKCTNVGLIWLKVLLHAVSTRKYGVRGPNILTVRSKQTSVRGHTPTHATARGVIRVPLSWLWVIQFYWTPIHEGYPNSRIFKEVMFGTCLNYDFGNVILRPV